MTVTQLIEALKAVHAELGDVAVHCEQGEVNTAEAVQAEDGCGAHVYLM